VGDEVAVTGSGKRKAVRTGEENRKRGRVGNEPTATLLVYVQPRATRTGIAGWHGDAIKIRVAAPPVDGAANEELVRFLADCLAVPRARVCLVGGASGRNKRLIVRGLDATTALVRLGVK
jgi:uncharacterized protein (TIGR00251 family)